MVRGGKRIESSRTDLVNSKEVDDEAATADMDGQTVSRNAVELSIGQSSVNANLLLKTSENHRG